MPALLKSESIRPNRPAAQTRLWHPASLDTPSALWADGRAEKRCAPSADTLLCAARGPLQDGCGIVYPSACDRTLVLADVSHLRRRSIVMVFQHYYSALECAPSVWAPIYTVT